MEDEPIMFSDSIQEIDLQRILFSNKDFIVYGKPTGRLRYLIEAVKDIRRERAAKELRKDYE